MIGRLEGRLFRVRPGEVIVDAGGVGYRLSVSLRAFETLAAAERAALWVHTWVREDQISLFGFLDQAELEVFERLITVAGVGPRTALAALSSMSSEEISGAVESGDVDRLVRVPGIGKKTAERIVLELKGTLGPVAGEMIDTVSDAISALVNLGYSEKEARRAVDTVTEDADGSLPETLRLALKALNR